ncbi:hypothetical protein NBO_8g0017 [Nosema bombycis CQ1]|uniref:Pyrimidine 5-nucleotidase n=1 Tax=Nosema bombycis (strain CQ1 / CVCC 102059) TaxID=578461 RepID=R0KY56_NOSB1|nr:hypothetical protein NBO_8g0017 [Nosema bombycis CQ1]|eukprot:EOB15152.1 hypothetical protein NBO_8g0017 [Nosema bombycis CQ1]
MKNVNIFIILKLVLLTQVKPIQRPLYVPMIENVYPKAFIENKSYSYDKVLIFDIDHTLYKFSDQLHEAEREGHKRVIEKYKNCNPESLYLDGFPIDFDKCYSTFNITPLEYELLKEVDYAKYIQRASSKLINYLSNCKYKKCCFTNGLKWRAQQILQKLEIEEYFDCVIVTSDEGEAPIMKPEEKAFLFVEGLLDVKPGQIYFFDDKLDNIVAAWERGWNGFLVGKDEDLVDLVIRSGLN